MQAKGVGRYPIGKNDSKNCSAFRIIEDLNLPLMGFYDLPDDREPKSRAAFFRAEKGHKDFSPLIQGDTTAPINYLDGAFPFCLVVAYNDGFPFR